MGLNLGTVTNAVSQYVSNSKGLQMLGGGTQLTSGAANITSQATGGNGSIDSFCSTGLGDYQGIMDNLLQNLTRIGVPQGHVNSIAQHTQQLGAELQQFKQSIQQSLNAYING